MANHVRYIRRRDNGVYYYERRVPQAVITATTRERVVRPWAQQFVRAELGESDQEELDRLIEQRGWDAERLRAVLLDRQRPDDPRLPDISSEVEQLVAVERLRAPQGSTMRAMIARAVRDGHLAAQREIDAILAGTSSAIPPERIGGKKHATQKISEVMSDYIGQLRAKRTIREAEGAATAFIAAVGDLPLDEIERADVVHFCKVEGSRTIGGKTTGSVMRPVSPDTLKKKVGLLRAAINHAIETDRFTGPNPAAKIDAKRFTKPVPKALMPDKRPFTVHEMQLLFQHPWFWPFMWSCARTGVVRSRSRSSSTKKNMSPSPKRSRSILVRRSRRYDR